MNFEEDDMEFYVDTIHDEENDVHFKIQYSCMCGLMVFRLKADDYGFACEHCDSVCEAKELEEPCKWCANLFTAEEGV